MSDLGHSLLHGHEVVRIGGFPASLIQSQGGAPIAAVIEAPPIRGGALARVWDRPL